MGSQREQLEKALPRAADKGRLQEQVSRSMRESNVYSYQLAHLHEERDKALVDMSRLEEVAPLARQEHGVNRRMVSHITLSWKLLLPWSVTLCLIKNKCLFLVGKS